MKIMYSLIQFIYRSPALKTWVLKWIKQNPVIAGFLRRWVRGEGKHRLKRPAKTWADQAVRPVAADPHHNGRLRLAFVSPLPPARSGIANYSMALLPALAQYYDIEVVVEKPRVSKRWRQAGYSLRTPDWLRKHCHLMDRIIYQFGNSPYHHYMLNLLGAIPGVVVLHDFFLSDLFYSLEYWGIARAAWAQELYYSHGYAAVNKRYSTTETAQIRIEYPTNWRVLQKATGVITHSHYAKQVARHWYGEECSKNWKVIPLLQHCGENSERDAARQSLGFKSTDYLLCAFGFISALKLNHRLLEAWLISTVSQYPQAILIFVGEGNGDYAEQLRESIHKNQLENRVRITGWVDTVTYQAYLAAADAAVQLRAMSRGESSLTVLDCMGQGLPVIVNANGAFAELPANAVYMLPEEFTDGELAAALDYFYQDRQRRTQLGAQAQEVILTQHAPAHCAHLYQEALEYFYAKPDSAPLRPSRQFLVDISATHQHDLKTGIERVVRGLLKELLQTPPAGYRVEPVYLSDEGGYWHYKYARRYSLNLLNCPPFLADEKVEAGDGDLLVTLDWSCQSLTASAASGLHANWRARGVRVYAMVHDLLPVLLPQVFPSEIEEMYTAWLNTVAQFDGAVCVSRTVAADLSAWLTEKGCKQEPYLITWSHSGADIENSAPSRGVSGQEIALLPEIMQRPSFLMVGTIEPRKGYLQVIDAFSLLWAKGIEINLVIVGKEGWKTLPEETRRDIPKTIMRLRSHPELNRRLFWLEGISDDYLEKVYQASHCLIAASLGEGFGLPLIEAARHQLPIIARDIPVFREVAGEHAYYFSADNAQALAETIQAWLNLYRHSQHPQSQKISWSTWKSSAKNLVSGLMAG